ncbi:DNA cytosine methyltransferase [Anoxybacillus flavithermus]|uniref:DNA cytosine methyltransferase n=1 Tax=Anoxybacillus flavithermus TaxID=33934 RepID=UPI001867DA68|nr:DNA cytosine methyltransferase [Anoxybacillus flavithermus]MBE2927673.1 DNA cytosine methyltransferase [Anoxybacillus flavithermus]MBE2932639.1 DNA cytosine methyltransferase [Anoxybacillus flavithermus]MBE2935682.1 DNA cytosine methyltransferase [Anoxybacillus flavithermus]MBE2937172.1 DNA cytosine methyltransferase [Anoxybacillus flavithermus]
MVVIDLFTGAGGLSEGFHEEGYKIVAQVEKEKWACETLKTRLMYHFLKRNHELELYFDFLRRSFNYKTLDQDRIMIFKKYPELKEKMHYEVLNRKFGNPVNDPEATSSSNIIKEIEVSLKYNKGTSVDLIIGGPPCQAYSLIGRSRLKEAANRDSRNYLFYYYLKIVEEFRPRAFVFENVPGILTAKNGKIFSVIQEEFDRIGYKILSGAHPQHKNNIIDFSDYGTFQRRNRVILFGFRTELNYSYPDFSRFTEHWNEEKNTRNVIGDLPFLLPGQGADLKLMEYPEQDGQELSEYQKKMRENSIGILNHKARPIQERDREIYRIAIEYSNQGIQLKYNELPENLKTHRNEQSFLDRFKVHNWNEVPHTIVAHIAKDGHYNIHPDIEQARSLTVREAARIQGFPDNYKFEGPRTAQFVQVGNAVPPIMSKVIAKAIKHLLTSR